MDKQTFIKVPSQILDKLCQINLTNREFRILCCVMKKTWGWHKEEDSIALRQFVKSAKLDRSNVCKTIKKLLQRNILIGVDTNTSTGVEVNHNIGVEANTEVSTLTPHINNKTNRFKINTYTDSWLEVSTPTPGVGPDHKRGVGNDENEVLAPTPTKDTLTKDTLKRKVNQKIQNLKNVTKRGGDSVEELLSLGEKIKGSLAYQEIEVEVELKKLADWAHINSVPLTCEFVLSWMNKAVEAKRKKPVSFKDEILYDKNNEPFTRSQVDAMTLEQRALRGLL